MPDDESYPPSVYELLDLADGCNYSGRVPGHLTDAFDFARGRGLVCQHTGGFLVTAEGTATRALHRLETAARPSATHDDVNPTALDALKYVPLPPDSIRGDALAQRIGVTSGHLRRGIVTVLKARFGVVSTKAGYQRTQGV